MINSIPRKDLMNCISEQIRTDDPYQMVLQTKEMSMNEKEIDSDETMHQIVEIKNDYDKAQTEKLNKNEEELLDSKVSKSLQRSQIISQSQVHPLGDRQFLLQKRKSYSESVRQKNKLTLKQERSRQKKSINMHESLNLSYATTPPKDLCLNSSKMGKINNKNLMDKSQQLLDVQNEYYGLDKLEMQLIDNQVFRQSNCNSRLNIAACGNDKRLKSKNCSKGSNTINMTSMDLSLSQIYQSQSTRKSARNKQNKQNKFQVIPQSSTRNPNSKKTTSYAEIFDKKSTMNALINYQKSKGLQNTASRQLSSVKKDKQALKSMASPQDVMSFQFGGQQFSADLNTVANRFAIQQFAVEKTQNIPKSIFCSVDYDYQKVMNFQESSQTKDSLNRLQINIKPTKFQMQSSVSQTIDFSEEYEKIRKEEEKEIMVLAKQNTTFKRQLATFRKENSAIRKELQKAKDYIKELEQKSKTFLEQHHQFDVNQQQLQEQARIQLQSQKSREQLHNRMIESRDINLEPINRNLQQILISTERDIFSLKNTNKALQLKVYMLEKKLMNEQELSKKRLAVQVNNWRDKYNKLRNENIKLKNERITQFMNSQFSISMDTSREE